MKEGILNNPKSSLILEYTPIPTDTRDAKHSLHSMLRGTVRKEHLPQAAFWEYLNSFLEKNAIDKNQLKWAEYRNEIFSIHLHNWDILNIELKDIQKSIAETILPHDQKKKSEEKIEKLLLAIKSIYQDNDWILWDREINDDDKVKSTNFDIHGMSLEGLSLSSLRKLIEQEKWNLFQIYKVTWETEAKQKLLKEEINLFAGVWGLYEWGARYFSLSESEINRKVSGLLSTMSNTSEIFEYIKKINKYIRKNRKKSDMVTQVNGKLIQSLYRKTYERLKNENAPNKDFIECCKIMTWRWKSSGEKNGFAYENLTMEESFKDYQLGNEIIIHLMMKKWWVFDNMKKEFSVQDPEVEKNESPSAIISHSMSVLNNLGQKMPTTKTAQELLKDMHIPNETKHYQITLMELM